MLSQLLLLCGFVDIFLSTCTTDEDCNQLGRCLWGKCVCFDGVLGDNCEGKNLCHAELIQTCFSTHLVYCSMGGECVETGHGLFECSCRSGFSGPFCEAFTCKSDSVCHGRGQCILDDDHTYRGHCNCFHGYSGRDCYYDTCGRENITRNNTYLCFGGGECTVLSGTPPRLGQIFGCRCRPGFTGEACDSFICAGNRDCANDGTCDENTGLCTCKHSSFAGSDCGIANCGYWRGTEESLCSGNGHCIRISESRCLCNDGYTGKNCSSPLCTNGGECMNNGTCISEGEEAGMCACPGAYSGPLCESCNYPYSERPAGPGDAGVVCVPDECLTGVYVCNGAGVCVENEYDEWGCSCNRNSMNIDGACVPNDETHNKCVITGDGRVKTVCNNRGDCRYGVDGLWKCKCHFGSIRAQDGNCYALGCVQKGVVCSGRGDCVLNTASGNYSCQCGGSYTGNGATCTLKSGLVATSVIVPLLIIGAVAGFLCWWFLCHKKNGGNCFGGGGGSKPKRGKAIRLSDGDSLSVQSGISGFTSQL